MRNLKPEVGLDKWLVPNYGTKDNYTYGSLIHQYTESGRLIVNLDFQRQKYLDELKAMSKPQQPETSEAKPEIKPEVR